MRTSTSSVLADKKHMQSALDQAVLAHKQGEVPIGATVVDAHGVLISSAHNKPIASNDCTSHAEINAIRLALTKLDAYRFTTGVTLYVTVEPCLMCLGAIWQARVSTLVFGARQPKFGAVVSCTSATDLNSRFSVPPLEWREGVLATESRQLLQSFFDGKR